MTIYRWRFLIAVVFAVLILIVPGCSKNTSPVPTQDVLQQYFEQNILNRNFVVDLATDSSRDITSQFAGDTFRLLKNTYFDGPMTSTHAGGAITGTWNCNEDYSKLTINLVSPSVPAEFRFINREWKFTSKSFPVMKLSPWGTIDPKVLHMRRI